MPLNLKSMDNLNDLKKIWLTADTKGLPNSSEMVRIVKKYRNKKLVKIAAVVFVALLLSVLMVFVMFFYESKMWTTRLGEICILISSLILLATNLNSLSRFYKFNDFDNVDFIKFLEKTRLRQAFYHNKTQVAALTFCSVGLILYLIETLVQKPSWAIYIYAYIVIYLVVMWVIVRPRMYRKQSKKMNEMISRFEKLSNQIKQNEP